MTEHAEILLESKDIVGESIVWDDRNNRCFWVDLIGRKLQCLEFDSQAHIVWPMPDFATSVGLRDDGGLIVALRHDLHFWEPGAALRPLAVIEPGQASQRLNEGAVGPDGHYWVGSMDNNVSDTNLPMDMKPHTGRLYRVGADGVVQQVSDDPVGMPNTMIWTDTGRFITGDTLTNQLFSYELNADTGQLGARRIINDGFARGVPDGSCIDSEGYFWNTRVVGGGCVVRFDPEGRIDRVVDLPVSWPTSCTFGGADRDILLVTSARFTMDVDHLAQNPQEGSVVAVRVGVTGRPEHRFATAQGADA